LWNDEIGKPFDQIPQADFRRDTKIVGTKIESLREQEAHAIRKDSSASMSCKLGNVASYAQSISFCHRTNECIIPTLF
jgi:hypothetical protein